jgi:glutamate synthase domain-containing protein 3
MMKEVVIDSRGIHYKVLNFMIEDAIESNAEKIILQNVNGQRFILDGVKEKIELEIHGTAGDDLAAFMNGPRITVFGNAQDGVGNTMNSGLVVIHGDARDIVGHSMRGGKIFIKGDVGYRVGIHMKQYLDNYPVVVAGGDAMDFLGEYMAGGVILVLNTSEKSLSGDWVGTGIHGGVIYVRGEIDENKLGVGAKIMEVDKNDKALIKGLVKEFCSYFDGDCEKLSNSSFTKVVPISHRPYGKMYTDE